MVPPPAVPAPVEPAPAPAPPGRKLELDWLRLLVVAGVFVFHTGRFFDPEGWHVKNAVIHPWVRFPVMVFAAVSMPLLFVISGVGVRFALRGRGAGRFVRDRALRLLVPLAVGVFTHVLYQVYLERLSHFEFQGSFLEFVPRYFDGWYGFGGNFAWMGLHLWYLELLFVLSLLFLPLFLSLGTPAGERLLARTGAFLARRGGVYLLAVPVVLALVLPPATNLLGARWWGGWNFLAHACFFLSGYLLAASEALYESVARLRGSSLLLSAAVAVPVLIAFPKGVSPAPGSLEAWLALGGMAVSSWFGVLAILGAGIAGLRAVRSPRLGALSEAVLPFYVLHQSVILAVGWPVVRLAIPDLAKWAVILVVSLALTLGAYLLAIRPFPAMRVLFGMRARAPP